MRLSIEADVTAADQMLDQIAGRVEGRGVIELLGHQVTTYESELFATSGNGQWAPDQPISIELKGSGRTLVDTGELLSQLTGHATVEGDSVRVTGTSYARYLKYGARGAPPRDPAPEPPGHTVEEWAAQVLEYVVHGLG